MSLQNDAQRSVQVERLQTELSNERAAHELAVQRVERQLAEERAKLSRSLQQRADELDGRAAGRQEELLAAVQKAESLKRCLADTEASMLRRVRPFQNVLAVLWLLLALGRQEKLLAAVQKAEPSSSVWPTPRPPSFDECAPSFLLLMASWTPLNVRLLTGASIRVC